MTSSLTPLNRTRVGETMIFQTRSRPRFAIAATLLGLLATGCSVSIGGGDGTPVVSTSEAPHVPQAGLERSVKEQLTDQSGVEIRDVTCDGILKGAVGATQRCIATGADGVRIGVTVTTKSVSDTNVNFGIKVDDKPMG